MNQDTPYFVCGVQRRGLGKASRHGVCHARLPREARAPSPARTRHVGLWGPAVTSCMAEPPGRAPCPCLPEPTEPTGAIAPPLVPPCTPPPGAGVPSARPPPAAAPTGPQPPDQRALKTAPTGWAGPWPTPALPWLRGRRGGRAGVSRAGSGHAPPFVVRSKRGAAWCAAAPDGY